MPGRGELVRTTAPLPAPRCRGWPRLGDRRHTTHPSAERPSSVRLHVPHRTRRGRLGSRVHCHICRPSRTVGRGRGSFQRGLQVAVRMPHRPPRVAVPGGGNECPRGQTSVKAKPCQGARGLHRGLSTSLARVSEGTCEAPWSKEHAAQTQTPSLGGIGSRHSLQAPSCP